MGSIKESADDGAQEHPLTEAEFNYVMNINQARENVGQEYTRVISAFLHYIASSRLGYDSKDDLQFELDFTDKEHKLKVTKIAE